MDIKLLLINGTITVVVATITAVITSLLTQKQDIKKQIYTKRESLYINLFDLLNKLQKDNFLVFNYNEFVTPLTELWSELSLYASQELLDILKPLLESIQKTANDFWNLYSGEQYEIQKQIRKNDFEETEDQFVLEEKKYMQDHCIDSQYLQSTLKELIAIMRNDMGIKKNTIIYKRRYKLHV